MNPIISYIVFLIITVWIFCSGFLALLIFTATSENKEKTKEIAKTKKKYYWYITAAIALGPIALIWSLFTEGKEDPKNKPN